jgi:K+-sensing histidine kinase KdpD
LYMWDERSSTLNMVSYQGMSEDAVRKNITYSLGEGFIGKSAEQRSIAVTYSDQNQGAKDILSEDGWPDTQISIPLVAMPGQLLGTLNMGTSGSRTLSENDMALLITVSAQIALAIDKAQLYTKASEHAVELENIVAARTDQLSQAIDELWIALKQAREADRIKSLLLSTVSHELRTPLATIKGSASLLIEHHSKIRAPQRLQHLQDIEEEADKLTELISSLLDMSRIEAGTLQISVHPFNLADVTNETVQKARVRLKDRTFGVRNAKVAIMCSGDVRRVEQIIGNLIDNASKYSSHGTEIDLELSKTDHEAIVSVSDHGIGIDPEHIGHIFDRFYQVKMGSDSGRHGIGLGLAICRGLVEAQGGRIWAESKPKRGSTFSFSLPLHPTIPR